MFAVKFADDNNFFLTPWKWGQIFLKNSNFERNLSGNFGKKVEENLKKRNFNDYPEKIVENTAEILGHEPTSAVHVDAKISAACNSDLTAAELKHALLHSRDAAPRFDNFASASWKTLLQ